ncbi:MAG: murein L,D-transpeptidase catalytic domain family protein [Dysgonamonadaceae bacterium]|nr:murein L,D-transpeptidase catalytic domain family protein [Dysgonamonadaceae bacterium]
MNLKGVINYTAFKYAYAGYNKINTKNKDIMTLIDFSQPSTEERFFVLDMQHKKLLYSTYVAHGKNSGENYATFFSNKPGSNKSSPGFYITENTYQGRNGYSLILDGLEKNINDKAKQRSIVIHGADYCNVSLIESGRLGRSFGCPALPRDVTQPIIDTIKDGTILYIYTDNKCYLNKSKFTTSAKY